MQGLLSFFLSHFLVVVNILAMKGMWREKQYLQNAKRDLLCGDFFGRRARPRFFRAASLATGFVALFHRQRCAGWLLGL